MLPPEPAQPANAVGTTIQGPVTTNPDAPTASAGGHTPPSPAGPAGATTGTSTPTSANSSSGSTSPPSTGGGHPAITSGSDATASSKTQPPKLAPLPPIPFAENTPEARIEREKRAPARKAILDQDGIKPEDKSKVMGTEKGKRPHPKTYMSEAFIKAHREEFLDGASRIMATKNIDKYGPARKEDGTTFVLPATKVAEALKEADGDRAKLEVLLGMPRGQLGTESLSRVNFKNPASLNIRVPSGNEAGANDQWIPGAKLPTGLLEGVLDAGSASRDMWTHENLNIK